eukprot:TRINITY_DN1947_c0_g1_i1.p1 TRINITY_DN1947_c0_g1~~TRINITY_DN1947_c0_g1_i1.p1  ORF type:complete len:485 (+),score=79.19 TRINITY_DN1947_c0_g1_i1:109-1455(+)
MKPNLNIDTDPSKNIPSEPPVSPPADDEHARAVRIRSYTTLTTGKDLQTQKHEKLESAGGSGGPSQDVPQTDLEVVKFNDLFHHCEKTGKRPADKVFLKSGKSFSDEAAEEYYKANADDFIALCYDISDYEECFWNYKAGRFCTPEESEPFDSILESAFETKGSYLDEPITDKNLSTVKLNRGTIIASASMQGWRISNEDEQFFYDGDNITVLCVLDGHGGDKVASYVKTSMKEKIKDYVDVANQTKDDREKSIIKLFLDTDELVETNMKSDLNGSMGTTVNMLLMTDSEYIVANAGDTRLVLVTESGVVPLSMDHKPTLVEEKSRIEKAGGRVVEGRVEGILAVSRALGDFDFKQAGALTPEEQAVTPLPSIQTHPRSPGDLFIIQACDGIFDCKTDQEVASFAKERLEKGVNPSDIIAELCDSCLSASITDSGIGTDNMSINLMVL